MSSYVLRPNGYDALASAGFTKIPNTSTPNGHTSDDDDSTQVLISDGGALALTLTNPTLSAGENPTQVRVRLRYAGGFGSIDMNVRLRDSGGNVTASDYYNSVPNTYNDVSGAWRVTAPDGGAWTVAKVNDLQVYITEGSGSTAPQVIEVYVDVETNFTPTVSVTGPTGTIVDNMQPTVTASYTDTEGDAINAYELRVFSAAQYGIGGFDPATSPATYGSGTLLTAVASISKKIPISLTNSTTYRAYMRVKQGGTFPQWGDWSYTGFDIDVVPPNAPTFSATADTANVRVGIAVTGTGPALVTGETRAFELQYSTDSVTWTDVATTTPLDLATYTFTSPTQSVSSEYDYTVPLNVTTTYRARVRADFTTGAVIVSNWTTASPITVNSAKWWLKCLTAPALSINLYIGSEDFNEESEERMGVFRALGRATAIVRSDVVGGTDGTLTLTFLNESAFAAFKVLRNRRETLLLQGPYGTHLFIHLGAKMGSRFTLRPSLEAKRVVTIPYIEVGAP